MPRFTCFCLLTYFELKATSSHFICRNNAFIESNSGIKWLQKCHCADIVEPKEELYAQKRNSIFFFLFVSFFFYIVRIEAKIEVAATSVWLCSILQLTCIFAIICEKYLNEGCQCFHFNGFPTLVQLKFLLDQQHSLTCFNNKSLLADRQVTRYFVKLKNELSTSSVKCSRDDLCNMNDITRNPRFWNKHPNKTEQ